MKNILLVTGLLFVMHASADIEYSSAEPSKATAQEINKSRSCFQELMVQGCGDPGEDPQHFRSCLKNVHPSLTADCRAMMTELYGVK